ncbi:hypothetical protein MLD38_000826 [Melastoma candidum]|uniref:Uncharacterized protein n=1 Tax=Melastoma candidum TaxID=119954 RepID=A0ACB9SC79_9MYRT|nr:hypothetical protein MLD38_000826 [Melastoma candidum]
MRRVWRTGWRCTQRRDYGSSGEYVPRHIQMQIINALRSGDRTRASKLLLNLSEGNQSPRAGDFIHLLDYCAKSPDPLFAVETARVFHEKKIHMSDTYQILTMQALCKGGYLEEGYRMLLHLWEHQKIYPSLAAYNCLLKACVDSQSPIQINNCFHLMDCQLVGKNEATYLELLKIAVWQENISVAHQIWKDYSKHYSLSSLSLRKFIWAFSRLGDLDTAYITLQMMVDLAISNGLHNPSIGVLSSSRLDIPIPSKSEPILDRSGEKEMKNRSSRATSCGNDLQLICSTINSDACSSALSTLRIERPSISKELRWSFNDVLHSCAKARNGILADKLFQQMINLGLQPSSYTYDGYVRAIIPERGYEDALGVLKLMQKENLKPHDSTLAAVAISCSKALELDLAEELLGQISGSPHPYPFNACLAACNAMNQPERAVRLLAKMKQINVHPDITTYGLLFSLFGNVNFPYEEGNILSRAEAAKRISVIETDMVKRGVQHNLLSVRNLVRVLGQEGMIKELIEHLQVAQNIDIPSDFHLVTPVYNTVLHSLVEANEGGKAIEIFKNMRSSPCPPDAETYNIMIDCCSIVKCFRSACTLVSLMIRSGCLPVTTTFTILLKILLDDENYDEAFYLLAQARSEGMSLDVLFYNTLIKKLSEKGELALLEHVIELMRRDNVQPDPSTCSYVVAAYVDNGYMKTAMQALQVLSVRMISQDGTVPEDRRSTYNEFILSEDPMVESQLASLFEIDDDNLAFALLNLRWCAIEGTAPISWSPEESPWAQRLRIKYDQS